MENSVRKKFDSYPDRVRVKLNLVRDAIFRVAESHNIKDLTETLKWGQPSYLARGGSTIRIDWNKKFPDQICIYFHCQTKLVDTFKEIYEDTFCFEGNRSIVLLLSEELPINELEQCISMSLRYHKIKHLPLLGA